MNTNFKSHDGKLLRGISVNDYKFQGVTTLNQICDYGLDKPSDVEKAKLRTSSSRLIDAKKMHDNVQRRFDTKRMRRANVYRAYIENVEVNKKIGGTPAITLWNPNLLTIVEDGVIIPYGSIIVAIDGETQTEARFLLREDLPETGNTPIAITLYHGIKFDHAQQILHDYNVNSMPVAPKLAATMNHEGALSMAINEVISKSGVDKNLINRKGMRTTAKNPLNYHQMLMFLVGYQMGSQALNKSCSCYISMLNHFQAKEVDIEAIHTLERIIKNCIELSKEEKNMNKYSMCAPMVWQVAGGLTALGEELNWESAKDAHIRVKTRKNNVILTPIREQYKVISNAFKEENNG